MTGFSALQGKPKVARSKGPPVYGSPGRTLRRPEPLRRALFGDRRFESFFLQQRVMCEPDSSIREQLRLEPKFCGVPMVRIHLPPAKSPLRTMRVWSRLARWLFGREPSGAGCPRSALRPRHDRRCGSFTELRFCRYQGPRSRARWRRRQPPTCTVGPPAPGRVLTLLVLAAVPLALSLRKDALRGGPRSGCVFRSLLRRLRHPDRHPGAHPRRRKQGFEPSVPVADGAAPGLKTNG
jgi:hypothetical protein